MVRRRRRTTRRRRISWSVTDAKGAARTLRSAGDG
jgi:hypothetical protein